MSRSLDLLFFEDVCPECGRYPKVLVKLIPTGKYRGYPSRLLYRGYPSRLLFVECDCGFKWHVREVLS